MPAAESVAQTPRCPPTDPHFYLSQDNCRTPSPPERVIHMLSVPMTPSVLRSPRCPTPSLLLNSPTTSLPRVNIGHKLNRILKSRLPLNLRPKRPYFPATAVIIN